MPWRMAGLADGGTGRRVVPPPGQTRRGLLASSGNSGGGIGMGGFSCIDLLGLSAGVLTTGAYLPQAIKLLRTQHTHDLSLTLYLVMSAGTLCWLVDGLLILSQPPILSNTVSLGLTSSILALKLRHG